MAASGAFKLLNCRSPAVLRNLIHSNLIRPSAAAAATNATQSPTTTTTNITQPELIQLERESSDGSLRNLLNAKHLGPLAYCNLRPMDWRSPPFGSSVVQIEAARRPAFEEDDIEYDFDEDDDDEDGDIDEDDDTLFYSGAEMDDDEDDDEFVDDDVDISRKKQK